jgi:hypothetical protein
MFTQFKTFLPVASIFVGSTCFTPYVLAGEGGVAGAASFNLVYTGEVTESAAAVAIGKTTAYAGATAQGSVSSLDAFAVGTGVKITGVANSIDLSTINEESSDGLLQSQNNEISNDINIDVIGGTISSPSFSTRSF